MIVIVVIMLKLKMMIKLKMLNYLYNHIDRLKNFKDNFIVLVIIKEYKYFDAIVMVDFII